MAVAAENYEDNVCLTEVKHTSLRFTEDDQKAFLKNPFGECFDCDFWLAVSDIYGDGSQVTWSDALHTVRVKYMKERFILEKKDPLVTLIVEVYDKFVKYATNLDIMASFKQQLAEFAQSLLSDPGFEYYGRSLNITGHGRKSILHLCAERDLYHLAKIYVDIYSKSVYVTTDQDEIPLELALNNRHDDTASFLASKMLHQRVRGLFLGDECFDAKVKFCDIIQDDGMSKTVIAILESCVNSDWPFIPIQDEGDKKEEAWSKMPDMSLRYHFYYRLLDGDQSSEPALVDGEKNPAFKHNHESCLQLLAKSPHSKIVMYHPVVRKLVDRKWKMFGRTKIRFQFLLYIIFLVFLSGAFLSQQDKSASTSTVNVFRTTCECISLLFVFGYVINEVDEMEKERMAYWKDPYNYLDLIGLFLLLILLPLRFTSLTYVELGFGAAAYLINCLRIFKYFPAFRNIGIYSKTFAHIIYYDISRFALIYVIVFFAFGGAVYLSVLSSRTASSLPLKSVFLKEFRALAEGNPFADDYDSFNSGVTLLIMINMLVIIVILSNILIGQLSYRYELAMSEANIQYSIDKTKFICRLENSRFRFFNDRIKHYIDGDYVGEENHVLSLLGDWKAKKEEILASKII